MDDHDLRIVKAWRDITRHPDGQPTINVQRVALAQLVDIYETELTRLQYQAHTAEADADRLAPVVRHTRRCMTIQPDDGCCCAADAALQAHMEAMAARG